MQRAAFGRSFRFRRGDALHKLGKLEAATPPAAAASQVEVDVVGDAPPTKTANACCILM